MLTKQAKFNGLYLDEAKQETQALPIKRFAFAPLLILPLQQHIGKASIAVIQEDEEVKRGQLLAKADGFFSTNLHAPVSGTIKKIDWVPSISGMTPGIYLEASPGSTQEVIAGTPCDLEQASAGDIIQAIQDAGIVGLGGAAFPTHAKMKPPPGKSIDTLLINGAECEPYLSSDHRVMLEQTQDIITGIQYLAKACGAKKVRIGIEANKLDAAQKLEQSIGKASLELDISVHVMAVKYPQGADKLLIKTLLDRTVPPGGHAYDIGAVTVNVATTAEVGHLLPNGYGIQERIVTVTGPAMKKKGNFRITVGTPLRFIMETLGVAKNVSRVFLGGPMMGKAVPNLDIPLTKGVSGIVAFTQNQIDEGKKVYACIHCGHCVQVCPMGLNPSQLGLLAKQERFDEMKQYHLSSCFECGSCSYVCPAHIPLTQYFRLAKAMIKKLGAQST